MHSLNDFTPTDNKAACQSANITYNVTGSLAQAQSEKDAELEASYVTAHATGFISPASGTSIVYGF
jgi:hypothetical protein